MRCLKRNMTPFWYCLYSSASETVDEYGNSTGQMDKTYAQAVMMSANISPATGQAQTEMFGNLDSYDKVIVTDDLDCPIDEHTVLFIDKEPEYPVIPPSTQVSAASEPESAEDGEEDPEPDPDPEPEPEPTPQPQYDYSHPKYDYIVKRVAKGLNSVSIAVRKVDVG